MNQIVKPLVFSASQSDFDVLRCPKCKNGQLQRELMMWCDGCGAQYPVIRGIPILINDEASVFSCADYVSAESTYTGDGYGTTTDSASALRKVYHRLVSKMRLYSIRPAHLTAERALADVQAKIPVPNVLVLGAGDAQYEGPGNFFYTDVAFGRNTAVICDAHDLPFCDAFFDLVLVVAVLEHVADPPRCADEIRRVLKTGGLVYAATPFMQPVHMGAYDFTRYTYLGHRRLFRWFDDVSSGSALGPAAAFAWSLQYFASALVAAGPLRKLVRLLTLALSIPIRMLDYLTRRNAAALDCAGGVYFFGSKRTSPLADREIIALYRGGGAGH